MGSGARSQTRSLIARLTLTILGVLLMVGPPYALVFLNLAARFRLEIIAGIQLVSVIVGFTLLYFGLRERESTA